MSVRDRFWQKVDKESDDGCWVWSAATDQNGYGRMNSHFSSDLAHRISMKLEGEDIEGKYVLHKCDNPPCVNPDHLYIGEQSDNIEDAMDRDRMSVGENASNAKLSEEDVREIGELLSEGLSRRRVADKFGIEPSSIYDILAGNSWSHIEIPYREEWSPEDSKYRGKLSDRDVSIILALLEDGEPVKKVADRFGVYPSVIYRTKNGELHKDAQPAEEY